MAQSTTTLLQVANEVLLNNNERTLGSLSTAIGQQVRNAIRGALRSLMMESAWSWAESRVNASSWTAGVATLDSSVLRVIEVAWLTDNILYPVQQAERRDFDIYPTNYYTDTVSRPLYWFSEEPNIVYVKPYPTTVAGQDAIFFTVQTVVELPSSESGVFAIPEFCIGALIYRASALFALSRAEDTNLFNGYQLLYETEVNRLKNVVKSPKVHNRYNRRYTREVW